MRRASRDAGSGSSAAIVDDWAAHYQFSPSTLVRDGKLVARWTANALHFIDASTLRVVDTVAGSYAAICPADRDAIYALKAGPCAVERFDQSTSDGVLPIPDCSSAGSTMLVAGKSLYLATRESFGVYTIEKGGVSKAGDLAFRASGDLQWFGLADGRMFIRRGRSVTVFRGPMMVAEWKGTQAMAHLAPGSAGRIWYSVWAENEKNYLDRVVLAKTESGLPTVATFAAGRVTHLAAGPNGGVAILAGIDDGWFIVVLDRDGVETRRIRIAANIYEGPDHSVDISSCYVALMDTTVLLDTHEHLVGWDLATGTLIATPA